MNVGILAEDQELDDFALEPRLLEAMLCWPDQPWNTWQVLELDGQGLVLFIRRRGSRLSEHSMLLRSTVG